MKEYKEILNHLRKPIEEILQVDLSETKIRPYWEIYDKIDEKLYEELQNNPEFQKASKWKQKIGSIFCNQISKRIVIPIQKIRDTLEERLQKYQTYAAIIPSIDESNIYVKKMDLSYPNKQSTLLHELSHLAIHQNKLYLLLQIHV